jgi:hypothetical protein
MGYIGKDQNQVSSELEQAYTEEEQQPDADVSAGTVHRDIIDVFSSQIADAYDELENARLTISLKNVAGISTDALSQYALNFDVLRNPATKATGTITFQRILAPTVPISVPKGTLIQTKPLEDGSVITYITDADAVMTTTASKNPITGRYEVSIGVTAQIVGTDSHVGANSLTEMPNRTAGIDAVTNKQAINNATEEDDNDTLSAAIRARTAGTDLGTSTGIKGQIEDGFSLIEGVEVVGPFEEDNLCSVRERSRYTYRLYRRNSVHNNFGDEWQRNHQT